MTHVGAHRVASRVQRPTLTQVGLLLLPVVLVLGVVALYLVGNLYFSTERAMKANWGISVPDGLREVEHHEEQSFHGDGYRFTVFEIEDDASLEGTFFDVRQMSITELTSEQITLVAAVTNEYRPENYVDVPQSGLRKTERLVHHNRFLCLFDKTSNRFYVYEDIL